MSKDIIDSNWSLSRILETVRQYWGFDELRPLQEEAIRAGLDQRDTLVVLPTGGGKSLCYQVPAALVGETDVVVSPLISLMKDQVDGLRECGYPAAALHSGIPFAERQRIEGQIASGKYRLVFIAPERLLTQRMLNLFRRLPVRAFAIDEAHCISHWGHDFRPEYRQLATLKRHFPDASIHAYTATATPKVREDIVAQLCLRDPHVLVGRFDRPNLVYRIIPRTDGHAQALEVVQRHEGQAGIIYCLSRKDAEYMSEFLKANGVKAAFYHAGMDADDRRRVHEAFAAEKLDVVSATVAFGMGIDRSNVRFVIHETMPKSIEHYQQETGRAGRDGLEAECVLFYSASDVFRWESLIEKSAQEAKNGDETASSMRHLLNQMKRFCSRVECRHRMLSEYFGQTYDSERCGACDVCLEETECLDEGTVMAQKILSCVARVQERFGIGHVVDVLRGADTERVRQCGHGDLSTYGLLREIDKKSLTNLVYQLLDQDLLKRSDDGYPVLKLNANSWAVLRGQRLVQLVQPKHRGVKHAKVDEDEWKGVDEGLFESLRLLRRSVAAERDVPAYIIFGDATLREMARVRPGSIESFMNIRGVGQRKRAEFGEQFVQHIITYCQAHNLSFDVGVVSRPRTYKMKKPTKSRAKAFEMFAEGHSIDEVAAAVERARNTTMQYLVEFIQKNKPEDIDTWVDPATYSVVEEAASQTGTDRLKPIFEKLEGKISYDAIRLVARHMEAKE